jgi:hypothetical protein
VTSRSRSAKYDPRSSRELVGPGPRFRYLIATADSFGSSARASCGCQKLCKPHATCTYSYGIAPSRSRRDDGQVRWSGSARATFTVTATGTVAKMVWDMGNGKSVTCSAPGQGPQKEPGQADVSTCPGRARPHHIGTMFDSSAWRRPRMRR